MSLLPDGPIDTLGYLETVLALPEAIESVLDAGPVDGLVPATSIDHVVVVADGPLSVVPTLVRAVTDPVTSVPVLGAAPSRLPAFVGPRSLVLGVTQDEERSRDMAEVSRVRGAAFAALIPVDSGPRVPRLGRLPATVRVLAVLEQLGLFAEVAESVERAVSQARRRCHDPAAGNSSAMALARRIGRTLPVVYGADQLGGAAARSWKSALNTSAKVAAFANQLPDLGADEIAGWGQHGDMTRQVFSLVELRHDHEPAGVHDQMGLVEELLDEVVSERHVVQAEGDGALAQLFDLVVVGDIVAYHLAQELEIDPGPVAATLSS